MPFAPPRACHCGAIVPHGERCPKHQKPRDREARKAYDATRPNRMAPYDAAWKRCRSLFLKANPMCCAAGCTNPATEVDHIQTVKDRPDLRLHWSNLRAFCKSHHSRRTIYEQGIHRPKGNPPGSLK